MEDFPDKIVELGNFLNNVLFPVTREKVTYQSYYLYGFHKAYQIKKDPETYWKYLISPGKIRVKTKLSLLQKWWDWSDNQYLKTKPTKE